MAALLRKSSHGDHEGNPSSNNPSNRLKDFCKYVPLRLNERERALLAVLESTLCVSEYTDHVDVALRRGGKAHRILDGILEACNIATGLSVAAVKDSIRDADRDDMNTISKSIRPNNGTSSPRRSIIFGTKAKTKQLTKAEKQQEKAQKKALKKSKKVKKSKQRQTDQEEQEDLDPAVTVSDMNNSHHASSTVVSTCEEGESEIQTGSLAARATKDNAAFFRTIFEIGRRNKVLNPSKMRSTYGKLMYLLQDAQSPTAAKSLGFTLHKDLIMVAPFLQERACGSLLSDPRLVGATLHVKERDDETGEKMDRSLVQERVQQKRALANELIQEYCKKSASDSTCPETIMSEDDLRRCIDSISDAIAIVETSVAPVKRMLQLLEDNFNPTRPENPFSLEINGTGGGNSARVTYGNANGYNRYGLSAFGGGGGGGGGEAKLIHSHSTQYTFVWQSLTLWCKVQENMHRLWVCADEDLLSTTASYQLWNTGQGLNRVQSCPRVGKVMRGLLSSTQQAAGAPWVGLSVVHLGDRDVPNALVFIDKYTQIPRFLTPIVDFVDGLPDLLRSDQRIQAYVESQFISERNLIMTVLSDYFKHGFDGSGDDGGSCIDGRLTSSWNWTSRIVKKKYYQAFMLSGFQGFDGDFK